MSDRSLEEFFDGKPETYEIFKIVRANIEAAGPSEISVKSQISFGSQRKFAWLWLYNVTQKNPNGVLHLMLAIAERRDESHVRNVEQIGKARWNHQIVIRTLDDAQSSWLKELIELAYAYGTKAAG